MAWQLIALVWLHFFADFVLQSDTVARGKSTSNKILLKHVLIYGLPFLTVVGYWQTLNSITFVLSNVALHFVIDWYTSRVTSCYWKQERRHAFFVTIGADQAAHMTCLIGTYQYLLA